MLYYSSRSITSSKPIVSSSDIWNRPLKRNLRLVQRSNLSVIVCVTGFLYSVLDSSVYKIVVELVLIAVCVLSVASWIKIKSYLPPDCTSLPSRRCQAYRILRGFKCLVSAISWSTGSLDQPRILANLARFFFDSSPQLRTTPGLVTPVVLHHPNGWVVMLSPDS
jgi:hypothetical protein